MHTFDEVLPRQGRENHCAYTAAATPSITADVPAMTPGAMSASCAKSLDECTQLLRRFVLDPVETASVARIDSTELMRLYRAGVDRRIAEAGVARHGAARRPLATLGPDKSCDVDVLPGVGSSQPIQMGIASLSVAATVTSIVSAALCAIGSLLNHKPV
jgi:hypothetical protein